MVVSSAPKYHRLGTAVERVTGRRFHPSTICRWHKKGVKGIRLTAHVIGGVPMATDEMVEAFIAAQTAAAQSSDDAGLPAGE
jgi:hypothetical protein